MAKYNKIQTLVLMIALLCSFAMVRFGFLDGKASCEREYLVRIGDSCPTIAQTFNLSTVTFDSRNPNINCTALLVGQWRPNIVAMTVTRPGGRVTTACSNDTEVERRDQEVERSEFLAFNGGSLLLKIDDEDGGW
ncbi:hypothetical protein Q3G72_017302 [Acer saccharum]|nr:hypothetical protein Q3G72_017302 [Acer saccharum]